MKADAFERWMQSRYTDGSVQSRMSRVRKVEAAYGDLDTMFEADRLSELLDELRYSSEDERLGRPNETKLSIQGELGRGLSSLRNAVSIYRNFRTIGGDVATITDTAIEIAGDALKDKREGRQFEIERHLQDSLRRGIAQLDAGLSIVDGGEERAVESGFIDILARDDRGALTVIELKAGQAKRDAVGQILGYMGDLKAEEPQSEVRGILVAASFDKSCKSAVAVVPGLTLREYRFDFRFSSPDAR